MGFLVRTFRAFALVGATAALTAQASGQVAVKRPDFAGRDRAYSYLKSSILAGLKKGANFADHFTIVTNGCGTGCSSNLIINRRTGKVSEVPYGGEQHNMLTLRYKQTSNLVTATWFDDDVCRLQVARWTGTDFVITSPPQGRPDAVCNAA